MPNEPIRIEDHVRIFHAECGGIVTGELGKDLRCAECAMVMDTFVSNAAVLESISKQVGRIQTPIVSPAVTPRGVIARKR